MTKLNLISEIVNLDLHPVTKSNEYLNTCKEKLKNDSVLQLDNFLLPKSLEKIQNEANALHSKAYYCSQNHTILLNQKNNTLDDNDPINIEVQSNKGCVPHDLIPSDSDLSKLYNANDFINPTTTAEPAISYFFSSINLAGLSEMPPVSKHTPLPTNARGFFNEFLFPFHSIVTKYVSFELP